VWVVGGGWWVRLRLCGEPSAPTLFLIAVQQQALKLGAKPIPTGKKKGKKKKKKKKK
jgi:hypothetical protein